jgi:hypothetical protein
MTPPGVPTQSTVGTVEKEEDDTEEGGNGGASGKDR